MRAVLASDLSPASRVAVSDDSVLESLRAVGVTAVDLVTVVDGEESVPGMDLADKRRVALERREAALETAGFDVAVHVRHGVPHRQINDVAVDVDADLVVVGSSGTTGASRLLGSTARDMARTTVRPLVVVRVGRRDREVVPLQPTLFGHVCHGTDFSENAARAQDFLEDLEGALEAVTVVHVRESDEAVPLGERLAGLGETLETAGVRMDLQTPRGDPAEILLETAATVDADTILVGSRGQGRLRRLLLGSVSDRVVADGDTNVIVVPPTDR